VSVTFFRRQRFASERRRIYRELHDGILPRLEDRELAARLRKTGIVCGYDIKPEQKEAD
jgi:hypothetical protein